MSSYLKLKTLKCLRQHDLTGKDEPMIRIDGDDYWRGVINKKEDVEVMASTAVGYQFTGSVTVALYEESGSAGKTSRKQIGSTYTLREVNGPPSPMDFKTSGTHYTLEFTVEPVPAASTTGSR